MKMRFTIAIVFCLWGCLCAYGAWQPIVRNHSPQEYAAGTQNWHMMQATNGWIHAANNYGMLVYDGKDWRLAGVWNSSGVRSFAEGPNGTIYAGATNDFGKFWENEDYHWEYCSLADSVPAAYRKFGEVWQVMYDEGLIYVQTRNYIFVCTEKGHVEVIDPASIIYASIIRDHCLYVSTSNGIYLYSGKRLHTLEGSDLLRQHIVCAMVPYGEHGFLIGTDFAGVFSYEGSSLRPFPTQVDGFIRKNQLYSMAVNRERIAFGTVLRGLAITDLQGENPVFVDRAQGLQNSTVLSLEFDRDGNLWTGLDQGIDEVQLHSPLFFLNNHETSYGSGYTYVEYGGNQYFGTNQGLYMQPAGSDQLILIEGSLGQVWKLVVIENTLFCCHNRGLFVVGKDSLTHLDIPEGVWNVLQLPNHHILACTYNGLYVLEDERDNGYMKVNRIRGYDETVLYAEFDRWGKLWTISSRGLERLSPSADSMSAVPELMMEDPARNRYSLSKIGDDLVVSAEGYLAIAQADGTLEENDSLAALLDGKHRYDLLKRDDAGNLVYLYDGMLKVRRFDPQMQSYDSIPSLVLNNNTFFVGGFANLSFSGQNAVLGGVEGFFLMDMQRAARLTIVEPWAPRRIKVYVPWYLRWWAWLLYVALIALVVTLVVHYVRNMIRYRDERLAAEREAEIQRQQLRIAQLEREQAQFDLKAKSRELNSALLNKVNRNEMSALIQRDVRRITEQLVHGEIDSARKGLLQLDARLSAGVHQDKDWQKFEENFDFANDRFLQKLSTRFPWMSKQEKKLCIYIHMGLQTKEIGPLLDLSTRGVEMMRYRIRKKMNLDAQANMRAYFDEMLASDEGE